jgi:hypothetical protein
MSSTWFFVQRPARITAQAGRDGGGRCLKSPQENHSIHNGLAGFFAGGPDDALTPMPEGRFAEVWGKMDQMIQMILGASLVRRLVIAVPPKQKTR